MTHWSDRNTHAINAHLAEREAYDERQCLARLVACETCGEEIDPDEESISETGDCETCMDARFKREYARLKPLYDAEKRAGLLKPKEELDAELRDAGRGHLVRP